MDRRTGLLHSMNPQGLSEPKYEVFVVVGTRLRLGLAFAGHVKPVIGAGDDINGVVWRGHTVGAASSSAQHRELWCGDFTCQP